MNNIFPPNFRSSFTARTSNLKVQNPPRLGRNLRDAGT